MFNFTPRPSAYLFPKERTIIAHRGGAHEAPENTLAAFEKALLGRYTIELDVRSSRDGRLVVFHDETLERITNGAGRVADRTVEQLKLLDAGNGERIPALKEVLERVRGRVPVIIEVKSKCWTSRARRLVKMLVRDLINTKSTENAVVASFNWRVLRCVRRQMPYVLRALVFSSPTLLGMKMAFAKPDILMPEYRLVNRDFVNRTHAEGFKIFPWIIDHAPVGGVLLADGVDGLISNCPHALKEALDI